MLLLATIFVPLSACMTEARELRQGEPAHGTLESSKTEELRLSLREGDFVRGRLESAGGNITLDLVSETGAHVRRLASPGASVQDFMFIGTEESATSLRLSTDASAQTYILTIEQIAARADQRPPSPSFLSPRLSRLAESLATGGSTERFWTEAAQEGTPLVEPAESPGNRIVSFVWRGAKHNVRLFGAPSSDHDWMERLGDSDVWYKSYEIPSTTRLSYKFAPDIPEIPGTLGERRRALLATAQVDPLNKTSWPVQAPDIYNQESVVELPDAPAQPWISDRGAAKGSLTHHRFASSILGNERDVYLYTSNGFKPGDPEQALLVLFDANSYLEKVPTPLILDNLVAERKIPPLVAVLVGNPSSETRSRELPCNPDFARALATEILPWAREHTKAAVPAARTVVAGSSYGGLASACVAHANPDVFGNVLSLSGSFWWQPKGSGEPEWLTRQYAASPAKPIRFFLSAGLFEMGRDQPGILETTRHLRDVLVAKGYTVAHREYAASHDYLAWRGALADGLISLFMSQ
ncbi:MAG TPA: enterochelin esterase [Hyphomicrobium sp.]|nr:enterochelin esterase [Hyphomicrobium sp.]